GTWDTVFFTGSYQDFLTDMCETLADDSRISTSRANNYISALNDLYGDRDSVSGVDLNDEAMNMMQYNKAYSASCRLLTTLDEMIDKLVNGTAI
ncbi:MAG: flagellar hook-associated protein FlgK, partial [Firmicutes bacterium]|nr:flagellar hook-associated protein FlgK [Bacillota bacterium]